MRYVALGDSYTIGTSVRPVARWPDQLVAALGPEEPALHLVANLAVDGYTSADLIRDELPALEVLDPEFATVLIGVNDLPTVEPSVPAHETAPGEVGCRTCHVTDGEAGKLPDDHLDRPATLCLSCHEVVLGATPGSSPRIKTWPAPSALP